MYEEYEEYSREKAREAFEEHGHDRFEGYDPEDDDMNGMISSSLRRTGYTPLI
jgi:hypothetical protein